MDQLHGQQKGQENDLRMSGHSLLLYMLMGHWSSEPFELKLRLLPCVHAILVDLVVEKVVLVVVELVLPVAIGSWVL